MACLHFHWKASPAFFFPCFSLFTGFGLLLKTVILKTMVRNIAKQLLIVINSVSNQGDYSM